MLIHLIQPVGQGVIVLGVGDAVFDAAVNGITVHLQFTIQQREQTGFTGTVRTD
eukprot:NODE_13501_length_190_cov_0.723404_g12886_i0.p2 GENE.NODE_13501_length_190_cov_0.723404_g12886_i0~~NODE_13501_length_190_cov_0.723404_g12886_i0.p2  ORF type:complete len:54 (-),score=11.43 NODE_13501_length_190_cov_0.723404_g12886_i0:29-190(-)